MEYFKVLTQTKFNTVSFSKKYNFSKLITGKSGYSFGVKYSPNEYKEMLSNDYIFNLFIDFSVKQLMMNNWKFINLIKSANDLKIKLVDCEFVDIELHDVMSDEDMDITDISYILENDSFEISKLYFRTSDLYMLIVMNNGVIGIDEELLKSEHETVSNILDFLSYGKEVLYE
ncbi:TPA: hypothetical protein ACNKJ7_001970 [Enterococcus faecium]|uniref:hypothetical protein n=1 Tax=Enterococcus TaxID=1350 RepID=UPI001571CA40|nr:hypothetical protein [Enterococcus faecium]EMF0559525.1 hypothetical protein [Enterococcus faecium]MDV5002149.1 hypothetical protein [Enterococcus faecium]NTJ92632.1 hypothetical protein [Enterococcus faecium]NTR02866.1 hypothetical protein [Enterococcus faecium]HAR1669514.1 hypothetical protein [Enterococcus faecium]